MPASGASISRSIRSMPDRFKAITRWGDFAQVMAGIDAAQRRASRSSSTPSHSRASTRTSSRISYGFAHGRGFDLTLIETMPMGDIDGDRTDQYLPLSIVRARLMDRFTLEDIPFRTGGPARYVRVNETGGRLGFITPMTHNFCESCNRVRLTCTGTLYMCLGQDDAADLRARCAPAPTTPCLPAPSTRPSRASPRATTSSSTGAPSSPPSPAT